MSYLMPYPLSSPMEYPMGYSMSSPALEEFAGLAAALDEEQRGRRGLKACGMAVTG